METIDSLLSSLGHEEPHRGSELHRILDASAEVLITHEPGSWAGRLTYLLEAVELKAGYDEFEHFLRALRADIDTQLEGGRW